MSSTIRSSKLKFKGEKTKKKRKREDASEEGGSGSRRRRGEEEQSPDTWVRPGQAIEIRGPTFIFHPSDPSPICINFDSTRNRIMLHPLVKGEADDEEGNLMDRVPSEVSQVWVTTRVAGSLTINLRTGVGEGKFLSCDKHGLVSADREARGPEEEWTPVVYDDGMVAFQNVYEKYLSVDEVAGQMQLRGDSDNVGFGERFYVKIQSKYKKEAHEEEKKKKEGMLGAPSMDEAGTNKIYQAWGAGKSIVSRSDRKELKQARDEGRLAEALLDRRAKLKSDRFC